MAAFCEYMAGYMGDQVTGDQVKLIACVVATYPCALIYRKLPAESPTSRHLFSIAYTLFTMVYVLQFYTGILHIGLTSIITYVLMRFYRSKSAAYINFVMLMISMSICHIDRQIKGYEGDTKLDYSGALMVLVIKLSSFGFNVSDGRYGAVTSYNKRMKVEHFPSLIEYFGWICFFGGFFVGPSCEYMEYFRYTNFYFLSGDRHLSPYRPSLIQVAWGAFFGGLIVVFASKYNFFRALDDSYAELPFYKKMVFLEIAGFMTRCKFYCIWLLSEGSCVLSGFGYNGIREGRHRWDRLRNIAWFSVETSQSFKELSGYWNLGANNWLRHYVYLRVMPPGAKPSSGAVIATYTTSALWHGFHPGYYMLFCIVGVYQIFTRRIRRVVRPLFMTTENPPKPLPWKKVYDVLGSFLCMRISSLLTIPFDLLFISRVRKVWASVYYIHILLIVVAWPLLILMEPALVAIQKRRKSTSNDKSTEDIVRELELKKGVM